MANFLAPVPDGQMLLANEPASDNAPPSVRPSSLIQRELYRDSLHKQQTGGTRIPPLPGPPAGAPPHRVTGGDKAPRRLAVCRSIDRHTSS